MSTYYQPPPQFDDSAAAMETRRMLYQLITLLRRNARNTSSADNKALFDTSAEVVTGLARAFRTHQLPSDTQDET